MNESNNKRAQNKWWFGRI